MDIGDFKKIDRRFAPVPFWSWNDKLNEDELMRQMGEMADKGLGGFFMHPRVGLLTAYGSDEWYRLVEKCADSAAELGISPWLYDEDRWPSGFAGGEVPETEEYRARALVLVKENELTENDTVLDIYEDNNVKYFIAKRVTPVGDEWYNGLCYVDLMNKDAVRKFLEVTHERYKMYMGEKFGKEIPGIFTDEPNYILKNSYKCPALPWSEHLEEFFFARHGYRLGEHLKELFFKINDFRKIRHDFFESASNLLLESFTKQYYKWCDDNNLKLVGHFMAEDSLNYQIGWTGFIMPHYEFMHYPGIDKLGRRVNQNITVKQVSTVAEQLNKERTLSEVFGCIGQQCGFRERKWLVDWQAVLGINFVNPHLALYSMRGERKRDFPANLFYQQPYWKEEKIFSDYTARLSKLVSKGRRDTDILVIHTVESAWCEFDSIDWKDTPYDRPFNETVDLLIESNLDFHFGDESILKNHGEIRDGKICVNDYAYSTVVVPPACTLKKRTAGLLGKCGNSRIIFIGEVPSRLDGEPAEGSFIPENAIVTENPAEAAKLIGSFYEDRVKTIDHYSGKNAKKLYTSSKIIGDEKVVLFANVERTRDILADIVITDERTPYLLDLSNGNICSFPYKRKGREIHISARFSAAGSIALLLTDNKYETDGTVYNTGSGVSFTDDYETAAPCILKDITFSEENVMPVNKATLYISGECAAENMPLCRLWNDYFYRKPDGTRFACEYTFYVDNFRGQELTAVVECAQNLDRITLNGTVLTPARRKNAPEVFNGDENYKDVNFVRVPLKNVADGKNVLRIEGVKINNTNGFGGHRRIADFENYNSTELDAVYILGNFSVTDRDNSDFRIDFDNCDCDRKNLTGSGYPFYAGTVLYRYEVFFENDGSKPYLKLNGADCTYARVRINGVDCGLRYMRPFVYEAELRDGKNIIEVEISSTLFNLLGPNWTDGLDEILYVSPEVFANDEKYTDTYKFIPLGIKSAEIIQFKNEDEQ